MVTMVAGYEMVFAEVEDALVATRAEPNGFLAIDSGATAGAGSLEALEALQEERARAVGDPDMKRRPGASTRFRCGDGETLEPTI